MTHILGMTQKTSPVFSGLSESGVHSKPCFLGTGGQAWILFVALVLFGYQVVAEKGHGNVCVHVCLHVWMVSAWAMAA